MKAGEQANSGVGAENFAASPATPAGAAAQAPPAPERLWRFALAVYAQPAVAPLCLVLQDDHQLDVNLLIFAAWAGSEGRLVTRAGLIAAQARCLDWREQVIEPLRTQRRQWSGSPTHAPEYAAIKALEIDAERVQLGFLADLFAALPELPKSKEPTEPAHASAAHPGAIRDNLLTLCQHYALDEAQVLQLLKVIGEASAAVSQR